MNKLGSFAILLMVTFCGTGCSLMPGRPAPESQTLAGPPGAKAAPVAAQTVKARLYRQYQQWQGTRYAYGGLGKQGVDCSGFVSVTYRDQLGIKLPRTTRLQAQIGREVERSDLRPGDLVFFTTGFKARHVGIYLEKGEFLHVSTKRGVMISHLADDYWRDRYRSARRIVFSPEPDGSSGGGGVEVFSDDRE